MWHPQLNLRFVWCGCLVLSVLVAGIGSPAAMGASRKAARQVSAGIRAHRAGRYDDAEKAFADAGKLSPEDARITFNRACALAAKGEAEQARALFQSTLLDRDVELRAATHYNLGGLAAQEAKSLFGEHPEEADATARTEGLERMAAAVRHYRDCLRVQPTHTTARHNLELLRLWIKQMQDVWARRDREQRRDEMNLVEFLEMLWSEQRALRATTKLLTAEADSPQQRRALAAAGQQQQLLLEEIAPLREKIFAELDAPPGADPASEDLAAAREVLSQMVERVRSAMSRANSDLAVRDSTSALQAQAESLAGLDDLYLNLAPLEALVAKATLFQEPLVRHSKAQVESTEETIPQDLLPAHSFVPAENQELVAGWAGVLADKARAGLQSLEAAEGSAPSQPQPQPGQADQPEAAAAQMAAVRSAYQKAIEVGPRVHELATSAAGDLQEEAWLPALPKQEEALRLLQEITAELPKQENQQQEPQNEDSQEQGQQPQDQGQDPQQEDSQPSSDSEPKDDEQKEADKPQDKNDSSRKLSQQQAEALLRQVRQREREHRERQRELQRYLRARIQVDKDW